MFDPIRNRYGMRCPVHGTVEWVPVSSFRIVRRLRGATSPAVFRVEFDCPCGQLHESLVAHDELDWEPLGTDGATLFTNLLTGSRDLVGVELASHAEERIRRGSWPWSFWCHPEHAVRPGFPSSLRFVTPGTELGDRRVGVLVRCYSCHRHTVNIVSPEHLDVPWHNDASLSYVAQIFDAEHTSVEEQFRRQLHSGRDREAWLDNSA